MTANKIRRTMSGNSKKKIQKERVIKDDSFNLEIEMSKVKKHLPSPSLEALIRGLFKCN